MNSNHILIPLSRAPGGLGDTVMGLRNLVLHLEDYCDDFSQKPTHCYLFACGPQFCSITKKRYNATHETKFPLCGFQEKNTKICRQVDKQLIVYRRLNSQYKLIFWFISINYEDRSKSWIWQLDGDRVNQYNFYELLYNPTYKNVLEQFKNTDQLHACYELLKPLFLDQRYDISSLKDHLFLYYDESFLQKTSNLFDNYNFLDIIYQSRCSGVPVTPCPDIPRFLYYNFIRQYLSKNKTAYTLLHRKVDESNISFAKPVLIELEAASLTMKLQQEMFEGNSLDNVLEQLGFFGGKRQFYDFNSSPKRHIIYNNYNFQLIPKYNKILKNNIEDLEFKLDSLLGAPYVIGPEGGHMHVAVNGEIPYCLVIPNIIVNCHANLTLAYAMSFFRLLYYNFEPRFYAITTEHTLLNYPTKVIDFMSTFRPCLKDDISFDDLQYCIVEDGAQEQIRSYFRKIEFLEKK